MNFQLYFFDTLTGVETRSSQKQEAFSYYRAQVQCIEVLIIIRHARRSRTNQRTVSVTDGLFRESCLAVAKQYEGKVQCEEQLVDSMVYKMIRNPENYDVVSSNMV